MAEGAVPPFTRARIARLCGDALRRAGLDGILPTPLGALAEALGIRERIDRAPPRVLGALWLEERALFVDGRQSRPRRRFTEAHELGHLLCPWHAAAVRLDTAAELFGEVAAGVEAEANVAAGELIFQGDRFTAEAAGHPRSLHTPLALAPAYGASVHAAAHHYVERHAAPMALLVAGRWPGRDGGLPVWRTVASPAFAREAGRLPDRLPPTPAVEAARRSSVPVAARLRLAGRPLHAEFLNNRHCHLVLVRP